MKTYLTVLTAAILMGTGASLLAHEDQASFPGGDEPPFYSQLRPHGTWIQVAEYGYAWRPHIAMANRAWQPYHDGGQWVLVNNSWCWKSSYNWGSVAFQYGRWTHAVNIGWVWLPSRERCSTWVVSPPPPVVCPSPPRYVVRHHDYDRHRDRGWHHVERNHHARQECTPPPPRVTPRSSQPAQRIETPQREPDRRSTRIQSIITRSRK